MPKALSTLLSRRFILFAIAILIFMSTLFSCVLLRTYGQVTGQHPPSLRPLTTLPVSSQLSSLLPLKTATSWTLPPYGIKPAVVSNVSSIKSTEIPPQQGLTLSAPNKGASSLMCDEGFLRPFTAEFWLAITDSSATVTILTAASVTVALVDGAFHVSCGRDIQLSISTQVIESLMFRHIAVVYDGSKCALYIDSRVLQAAEIGNSFKPHCLGAEDVVAIGISQSDATFYIQELRLWSTARSVNEIQQTMNVRWMPQRKGVPFGLVCVIPFGSQLSDTTENWDVNVHGYVLPAPGVALHVDATLQAAVRLPYELRVRNIAAVLLQTKAKFSQSRQNLIEIATSDLHFEQIHVLMQPTTQQAWEDGKGLPGTLVMHEILAEKDVVRQLLVLCTATNADACYFQAISHAPCNIKAMYSTFQRHSTEFVAFEACGAGNNADAALQTILDGSFLSRFNAQALLSYIYSVSNKHLHDGDRGALGSGVPYVQEKLPLITIQSFDRPSWCANTCYDAEKHFKPEPAEDHLLPVLMQTVMKHSNANAATVACKDDNCVLISNMATGGKTQLFAVDGDVSTAWNIDVMMPYHYVGLVYTTKRVIPGVDIVWAVKRNHNTEDVIEMSLDGNSWRPFDGCVFVNDDSQLHTAYSCVPTFAAGFRVVFAAKQQRVAIAEITASYRQTPDILHDSHIAVVISDVKQHKHMSMEHLQLMNDAISLSKISAAVDVIIPSVASSELAKSIVQYMLDLLELPSLPNNVKVVYIPPTKQDYDFAPKTKLVKESLDVYDWWLQHHADNYDIVLFNAWKCPLYFVLRARLTGVVESNTLFVTKIGRLTETMLRDSEQFITTGEQMVAKFIERECISMSDAAVYHVPTLLELQFPHHTTLVETSTFLMSATKAKTSMKPTTEVIIVLTADSSESQWNRFLQAAFPIAETANITLFTVDLAQPAPFGLSDTNTSFSSIHQLLDYVAAIPTRALWLLDVSVASKIFTQTACAKGIRMVAAEHLSLDTMDMHTFNTVPDSYGTAMMELLQSPRHCKLVSKQTKFLQQALEDVYATRASSRSAVHINTTKTSKSSAFLADERVGIANYPLVSVCIPTFNRTDLLQRTIQSVLASDYPRLEIIVVDDGTEDPVRVAALLELSNTLKQRYPRSQIVRQYHAYAQAARNLAVSRATGKYVFMFDDDDLLRPGTISLLVKAAERLHADVVVGWVSLFFNDVSDENNAAVHQIWAPLGASPSLGLYGNYYGGAGGLFLRSALQKVGGYTLAGTGTAHLDYELLNKLVAHGFRVETVPTVLYDYRVNTRNSVFRKSFSQHENRLFSLKPYLNTFPELADSIEFAFASVDWTADSSED